MLTEDQARTFAREWIGAWNSRDLEKILAHYSDKAEFSSPFIALLAGNPTGTIRGKDTLRFYFKKGLEAFPDLRFDLRDVLVGAASVTLLYGSVQGRAAAEVMFLDDKGRIVRALAHYSEPKG